MKPETSKATVGECSVNWEAVRDAMHAAHLCDGCFDDREDQSAVACVGCD